VCLRHAPPFRLIMSKRMEICRLMMSESAFSGLRAAVPTALGVAGGSASAGKAPGVVHAGSDIVPIVTEHYDVFISYRRSTGSHLASMLRLLLRLRGFRVFLDVDDLNEGFFDEKLLDTIKNTPNTVVVLSANALDRCQDPGDWVRREISAAIRNQCNVVPIMDQFEFPANLPDDMSALRRFNAVLWSHLHQVCLSELENGDRWLTRFPLPTRRMDASASYARSCGRASSFDARRRCRTHECMPNTHIVATSTRL
jgi:hypothetical protein